MGRGVQSAGPAGPTDLTEPVSRVLRWERAGGVSRVLGRDAGQVTIGLFTCDGGEEMDRFTSTDQQLRAFLDQRTSGAASPSAAP